MSACLSFKFHNRTIVNAGTQAAQDDTGAGNPNSLKTLTALFSA